MAARKSIFIGTAGWAIRREHDSHYDPGASHLARYATRFNAAEINSSFYRPHRRATYERWAASVPDDFRFAVKAPKAITHTARCENCDAALESFLNEVDGLGAKLGPLLFQLPPKFAFNAPACEFFQTLRARFTGEIACEPRHESWFAREPERVLKTLKIARVAADPVLAPGADEPGGWKGLIYHRLHGSPRVYHSAYEGGYLERLVIALSDAPNAWCIFDNTARGAAVENALELNVSIQAKGSK